RHRGRDLPGCFGAIALALALEPADKRIETPPEVAHRQGRVELLPGNGCEREQRELTEGHLDVEREDRRPGEHDEMLEPQCYREHDLRVGRTKSAIGTLEHLSPS